MRLTPCIPGCQAEIALYMHCTYMYNQNFQIQQGTDHEYMHFTNHG